MQRASEGERGLTEIRGGRTGERERERWMTEKKRSRAITRARYTGREGKFSSH